jgi:hypothetical protein
VVVAATRGTVGGATKAVRAEIGAPVV